MLYIAGCSSGVYARAGYARAGYARAGYARAGYARAGYARAGGFCFPVIGLGLSGREYKLKR